MYLFALSFALVFCLCFILIPVAKKIGLTDAPDNNRKIHTSPTPLVGGIAMFIGISILSPITLPLAQDLIALYIACFLLVFIGVLDDKFDISHWIRLGIQALSAIILIHFANIKLVSFGEIAWETAINLGSLGYLVTIIAVIGMINAFNMMDGMDGLASGLGLITLFSLMFLLYGHINHTPIKILALTSGALFAHFYINLGGAKQILKKIFMGDAGSMTLGFVITAFLIRYSQPPEIVFAPTTALWLVAVPLMDIAVTTSRRISHGKSPFHPDKTHVHHIFMRAGFNNHSTLITILCFQVLCSIVGIFLHLYNVMPFVSFMLFIVLFLCYRQMVNHAFKFSKWIKVLTNHKI